MKAQGTSPSDHYPYLVLRSNLAQLRVDLSIMRYKILLEKGNRWKTDPNKRDGIIPKEDPIIAKRAG